MNRNEFFKCLLDEGTKLLAEALVNHPVFSMLKEEDLNNDSYFERPPGAPKDDEKFKALCTGCDACMIACPVNVVMIDDLEKRYPVIYPEKDPCIRCDGFPCISACPSTALSLDNI